jgi:hypothetical protein
MELPQRPLKPYWFRPGIARASLIPNLAERFNAASFFIINPPKTRWDFPGSCLFSRLEREHGLVKCWLYSFKTAESFKDKSSRDLQVYWVDPSLLVELPVL